MMADMERRKLWEARIADYRATELSVREWCERQGVSYKQLRYWLKQFETQAERGGRKSGDAPKRDGWAEVEVVGETAPGSASVSPVTISIGSARIEVRPGFDSAMLSEVLRVVLVLSAAEGLVLSTDEGSATC